MTVKFTIPGSPRGKGRPRFSRQGDFVRTYTDEQTASYENLVKLMYRNQCGIAFLDGAIMAEITGYFPIPKSASKKKQLAMEVGEIKYTSKIDCDNLAKIALDSLNGIAYRDDSQVCRLYVSKQYAIEPRVEITLVELEGKK